MNQSSSSGINIVNYYYFFWNTAVFLYLERVGVGQSFFACKLALWLAFFFCKKMLEREFFHKSCNLVKASLLITLWT